VAEVVVRIMRLAHGAGLDLPDYATRLAAGLDLKCAIDDEISIQPMESALLPTGIVLALPEGFEAQVRPRSGLALRRGLTILNSPGTIDADYRGEVMVLLINLGKEPARLRRGDRIAQLVVAPVSRVRWQEQAELENTERGSGGYGSTGTNARINAK